MLRAFLIALLTTIAAGCGGEARTTGGLVTYWYDNPKPSIWAVRADGSHGRLILRNRQNAKRPRLSPDRHWVVFDGTPPGEAPLSNFDIQLVRLDGTGLRPVTHTRQWDIDAQWSPDGRRLAFTRTPPHPQSCADGSVWLVGRDGGGARRLAAGCGARWSPDGDELVFVSPSGRDLELVDADGGRVRALLRTSSSLQLGGWSRDDRIVYTASPSSSGAFGEIFVVGADGRDKHRVGDGYVGGWSPDGRKIVYSTGFPSPIYVMDADGAHRRKLEGVVGMEPDWR